MLTILITHNYTKIKSYGLLKNNVLLQLRSFSCEALAVRMQEVLFAAEGISPSLDFTISSAKA